MKKVYPFLLIFILLPLVNSQIIFQESPDEIYNYEDFIFTSFQIQKEILSRGYVEARLICEEDSNLIFKEFNEFNPNKKITFSFSSLASIKGDCSIEARFDEEKEKTDNFQITDKIDVEFELNNKFFSPLEEIKINGTTTKKNNRKLNGIIIISLENLFNKTINVENGEFTFSFILEKDSLPGEYELKINAIEKNFNGEIINLGTNSKEIQIKSSPTFIEIESEESVNPSNNLLIKTFLLDQAKNNLENETIITKIFNPKNELILQTAKSSGNSFPFYFQDNAIKGAWKINVYYGDLFATKSIYVNDNKKINFELINKTEESNTSFLGINISNIGNIDYSGVADILLQNNLSNEAIPLNINLSIGESMIYNFESEGNYNISIGEERFENIRTSPVTGFAIFEKTNSKKSLLTLGLLLFLLVVAFFTIRKFRKSNNGKNFEPKNSNKKIKKEENNPQNKNSFYISSKVHYANEKSSLNEAISKKESNKKIYSMFLNSSKSKEIEELLKKHGLELHPNPGDIFFTINYSNQNLSKKLIKIAKEIKNHFKNVSIIINSENFNNKISSISQALITKNLIKKVSGLYITENIFDSLEKQDCVGFIEDKHFKIDERIIKLYRLKTI